MLVNQDLELKIRYSTDFHRHITRIYNLRILYLFEDILLGDDDVRVHSGSINVTRLLILSFDLFHSVLRTHQLGNT